LEVDVRRAAGRRKDWRTHPWRSLQLLRVPPDPVRGNRQTLRWRSRRGTSGKRGQRRLKAVPQRRQILTWSEGRPTTPASRQAPRQPDADHEESRAERHIPPRSHAEFHPPQRSLGGGAGTLSQLAPATRALDLARPAHRPHDRHPSAPRGIACGRLGLSLTPESSKVSAGADPAPVSGPSMATVTDSLAGRAETHISHVGS
jgi:hypothetical protein